MKLSTIFSVATVLAGALAQPLNKRASNETAEYLEHKTTKSDDLKTAYGKPFAIFQPKVVVISMFELERDPWLEELDFVHNITIPGLSPLYPMVHCTTNYSICQMTTGEGEINAAASVSTFLLSPLFDFSTTYFLIAGIAGGEPTHTTMGSVTFAKYAVQVGLEYQVAYQDFITTNPNWTSGYFAYGTDNPWTYPANVYGTEVFELNEKLRDHAVELAKDSPLSNGTEKNDEFRQLYEVSPAIDLPQIVKCDSLTSDNYFTGNVLGDYFVEYTKMITNGSATYCATAQEDNASLEVFTRLDKYGVVDYNRVVVMRTISNFSRPPPSMANNTVGFFTDTDKGGIGASLDNLVIAGLPFVHDVLANWDDVYETGEQFKPKNYVGDIFGTLGGVPDFGKESFEVA